MIQDKLTLHYYRHNRYSCYYAFPRRIIPYYDLTIVLKGQMQYICDDIPYLLKSGDMIFCPVGTAQIRPYNENPADYVSFNFSATENLELVTTKCIRDGVTNEIKLLIALYDDCYINRTDNTAEKCLSLLKYLLLQMQDIEKSQSENPLVNGIKKYLHNNLSKKIKLEDLKEIFFFSPVYCDSVFKKETGHSIIDYLINERIEEAKKLIFEGEFTLSQISELVGFSDYNYFSRMFKKRTGYSPKNYK